MEIIKRVTDSRKRTWECFEDRCYFLLLIHKVDLAFCFSFSVNL
jgi:hypothetical protein